MKKYSKLLLILLCGICVLGLTGCSTKKEEKPREKKQSREKFDWSSYTSHGKFGEDGIAWVCKKDYSGDNCGYINKENKFIIEMTDKMKLVKKKESEAGKTLDDYQDGKAVILKYDDSAKERCVLSINDTTGNVIAEESPETGDCSYSTKRYANGNILIYGDSYLPYNYYLYIQSEKTIKLIEGISTINYKDNYGDGLLSCTLDYNKGIGYLDETGEMVLKITSDSNENYVHINSGTEFNNGKATLNFTGKDYNDYEVAIDKTGKWLNEPKKVKDR